MDHCVPLGLAPHEQIVACCMLASDCCDSHASILQSRLVTSADQSRTEDQGVTAVQIGQRFSGQNNAATDLQYARARLLLGSLGLAVSG